MNMIKEVNDLNLITLFTQWIRKADNSVTEELYRKYPEKFLKGLPDMPDYPNALDGLEFLLDHCSCVMAIRDETEDPNKLDISFGPDGSAEYFGTVPWGEFEVTKMIMRTMPHPHGDGYERMLIIVADFLHILEDLIKCTLKRVPKHETERFLMGRM